MKPSLNNKNILLTGATSGIGKSLLLKMDEEFNNSKFFLIVRDVKKFKKFSNSLKNEYELIEFDLKKILNIDLINEQINFETIDIVINNAGYALTRQPGKIRNREFIDLINVNLVNVSILTNEFINKNIENDSKKVLVNVGSIAGFFPNFTDPYYSSTKSFVNNLTLSLNKNIKNKNIKIKLFVPGLTHTEFFEKSRYTLSHKFPRLLGQTAEEASSYLFTNLFNKKTMIIPRFINKVLVFILRILY